MVYNFSLFYCREGAVDGLLCFLLKLLEEHGLLLRQPVETDVCIIVCTNILLLLLLCACVGLYRVYHQH